MKAMISVLCILFAHYIVYSQPESQVALMNMDGSRALLNGQATPSHLILGWYFLGDEDAMKRIAQSSPGTQGVAEVYRAFAESNWDGIIALSSKNIQSPIDWLAWAIAVNKSSEKNKAELLQAQLNGDHMKTPALKLELGKALSSERRYDEAVLIFEELNKSDKPYIRIASLQHMGRLLLGQRKYDKAEIPISQALGASKDIHYQHGVAYSLYLKSALEARRENFPEVKKLSLEGAQIARAINSYSIEYEHNKLISWANFMNGESLHASLEHQMRQVEVVEWLADKDKMAQVYNNLGYDLTVSGLTSLDSAIKLMTLANYHYADVEQNNGRWYTLMNLTWQHRLKGDFSASLAYGKQALAHAQQIADRHAIVETALQTGETLLAMGLLQEAEKYFTIGKEARGDTDDRDSHVFDIYYAHLLWEKGLHEQAISVLEKAVDYLGKSEVFYEMHGRALLALYMQELGYAEKAREQIQMMKHPRSDYIAFESRMLMATVEAALLRGEGKKNMAEALTANYYLRALKIGMKTGGN